MVQKLDVIKYGMINYEKAYKLQLELLEKRYQNKINDTLLLVEHPPVFTIGASGTRENIVAADELLNKAGIEVFETNRGGDITYHGPGQIVGYPILNLKEHKQDLHWLLSAYEEVFIRLLEKYNIQGRRIDGLTGVWVDNKKITAIGVGVKHWITYHGFAFNINPNLEHFSYIIPCGITDKGVTSLKKVMGSEINNEEVTKKLVKSFARVFKMEASDSKNNFKLA
ncbi:MAG: lipoyl(octanoyl) transferase LipB [Halanaerobium sp.]